MKPITFHLAYERSTKHTHRYSETEASTRAANRERPLVFYIQKTEMPLAEPEIEVEVRSVK